MLDRDSRNPEPERLWIVDPTADAAEADSVEEYPAGIAGDGAGHGTMCTGSTLVAIRLYVVLKLDLLEGDVGFLESGKEIGQEAKGLDIRLVANLDTEAQHSAAVRLGWLVAHVRLPGLWSR